MATSLGVTFAGAQWIYDDSAVLSSTPITMACWSTVPASASYRCLMSVHDASVSERFHMLMSESNGLHVYSRETNYRESLKTHTLAPGTLIHAAGVWASDSLRTVYLDGVAGIANTDTEVVTGIDRMSIGGATNLKRLLAAAMYHAAWWNVALTAGEISQLAAGANPQTIQPDNLIRYMPLASAATAASETIEPSTWTLSGVVSDGPGSDPVDDLVSIAGSTGVAFTTAATAAAINQIAASTSVNFTGTAALLNITPVASTTSAESEADRLAFFDLDEFGSLATINSSQVAGILEQPNVQIDVGEGPVMSAAAPIFYCRSSDISGVLIGQAVTIVSDFGSYAFQVVEIRPDGDGITAMVLHDA